MSGQDVKLAQYAKLMSPICQYDFRALFPRIVDQHILPPSIRLYKNWPYIYKEIDLTFYFHTPL